jgi:[acyl-carrier-protein] S-malonyltransferase
MSRRRALLVCPGRGSYGRASLGSLRDRSPAARAVVEACDAYREGLGRPAVSALDAEETFRGTRHVAGEHASLLTFACSLADRAELDPERFEVVGVCGNSMGWYTALVASGSLPLQDGIRLVETMAAYQAGHVVGGQIMTPLAHPDGTPDPARREAVEAALAGARAAGARAFWSIDLGSYAVLGADDAGLAHLAKALPGETRGERTFPVRLPLHSAFHTPLLAETSARARTELSDLPFEAPQVPLVDGRGMVFRPTWADPVALRDYTLGHQVTRPYHFHRGLLTALHHTGAEVVVLLGPGNSLGGPVVQALLREGWHGIRDRDALDACQRGPDPLVLSFGVALQRRRLVP